jgi:hypothetical protein
MRDVKRIDRILKAIGKLWKQTPDQRFYQLLINNGLLPDSDLWHVEDDRLEEVLKAKKT